MIPIELDSRKFLMKQKYMYWLHCNHALTLSMVSHIIQYMPFISLLNIGLNEPYMLTVRPSVCIDQT